MKMKMKKLLLRSCVLVLALTAGASAQNDWKGFYVGMNAGGTASHSDAFTTTVVGTYFNTTSLPAIAGAGAQHPNATGFNGGGQAGYNFQSGRFVAGFEIDYGALKLS